VTIGIGRNRMIAKIATKDAKPDGIRWIRPEQEDETLVTLPISRLPGVGPKVGRRLGHLNVKTIGDLRHISEESLVKIFGKIGSMLHRRCRGEDTRVIHESEIPRTISRETTFHEETRDQTYMDSLLHYLGERAGRSMRFLGLETRTIEVNVRYEDFQSSSAQRSLPRYTRLDREIVETALELLHRIDTRRVNVRHLGMTLSGFSTHQAIQLGLFDPSGEIQRAQLQETIDEVRRKFGHQSLVIGKSLNLLGKLEEESYGFVLRTPSLTK
jgi:DNA polymerase-4